MTVVEDVLTLGGLLGGRTPAGIMTAEARQTTVVAAEVGNAVGNAERSSSAAVAAAESAEQSSSAAVKFSRSQYGRNPTSNPVAEAIRKAGDGQPCPRCGAIMKRDGPQRSRPSAPHKPSLKTHFETVGKNMTKAGRRKYTRSAEAYEKKAICVSCNSREGAN
jgi:hypothetical protein